MRNLYRLPRKKVALDITEWTPVYFKSDAASVSIVGRQIMKTLDGEGLVENVDYYPDDAILIWRKNGTYIRVWFSDKVTAMRVKLSLT